MNGEQPRVASRVTRRRFVALAPLSLAGAALLAACGGAPAAPPAATSAPAPTTAPAAPAPTAAPTPAATTAPTAAPAAAAPTTAPAATAVATPTNATNLPAEMAEDQTLKATGFGNPTTLEPAQEGGSLRIMTQNVWRPAFYLDEKGQFLPGVCNKWEVTDDGLTYTLHVDPAARWSDGSHITASDIKASYEHSADPSLKTWTFPYLMQPVQGAQDVQDGKTKTISGLVAKDEGTLQITLAKPYTPFIKNLANYIGGIIKVSDTQKGEGWELKSTASGPFQVDAWNRDTGEVTWVQNKNWWGSKPLIQKVSYRYIKDNNTSSIMYDNNEMDVFLPADIISAQLRKGAHASELHLIPYGGEYYYRFRTDLKPFDDPKVRLAFLKATDMATAVQAVFQGGQVPATGIISPNLDCYQNLKSYYDPAGAKMALAASTYKTADALPPITIAVGTNLTEYIQLSEAVQQMWKQNLGVEVTIHQYDKATDPVRQTAQILRSSLGTIVYDPSASISQMALSENTPFNLGTGGGYKNAQVDDLLHKADTLPLSKEADRCGQYDQAENIVMSEAPYIPIIWVNYYYAVKPWVKNYASNIDLSLYTLASNPPLYIAKH